MIQKHTKARVFFESLNKDTMNLVDDFYDEDIIFSDPIVCLKNRQQVKDYYANLYRNVESISWSFSDEINDRMDCALVWKMTLIAKSFNGGKPVAVDGVSVIKFGGKEGKAIYHRDYFDMGAFVYEGVPVLGGIIRFVKAKMASHQKDSSHE